jgi:3'(2'), 5'-bisphosphate nucleotidase
MPLEPASIRHFMAIAEQAATEAGRAIMQVYLSGKFGTALKPDESPLTKADKSSHTLITEHLARTKLPVLSEEGAQIDYGERKNWEYFWLIDPLDGTKEFINKNGEFTVNIALVFRHIPIGGVIYVPCRDTLYSASNATGIYKSERGERTEFAPLVKRNQFKDFLEEEGITIVASRSHLSAATKDFIQRFRAPALTLLGSSLKFLELLEDRADIYPRMEPTMEWDTAAAHAILKVSNRGVYETNLLSELTYNKPDLTNPSFIAF